MAWYCRQPFGVKDHLQFGAQLFENLEPSTKRPACSAFCLASPSRWMLRSTMCRKRSKLSTSQEQSRNAAFLLIKARQASLVSPTSLLFAVSNIGCAQKRPSTASLTSGATFFQFTARAGPRKDALEPNSRANCSSAREVRGGNRMTAFSLMIKSPASKQAAAAMCVPSCSVFLRCSNSDILSAGGYSTNLSAHLTKPIVAASPMEASSHQASIPRSGLELPCWKLSHEHSIAPSKPSLKA
mmetsp:Transcript_47867/g.113756  ORF Transcript_47867/g.113756 Transcript_47867/m.113756 type:complete len:241 (-) Transcript_47867:28-750(-)